MGHIRLGRLPKTKKWEQVIYHLAESSSGVEVIADKVIDASQLGIDTLKSDKGLILSYWILSYLLWQAKGSDFFDSLSRIGIRKPEDSSALSLISNISEYLSNEITELKERTIYSELSQQAFRETLTYIISSSSSSLFQTTYEETILKFKQFSTGRNFAIISRIFFSSILRRYLQFFISKESSNHISTSSQFESVYDLVDFNTDLNNYCYQTCKIIEDFAGGWFSKKSWEGKISQEDVEGFIYVAIKKIQKEINSEIEN